LGEQRRDALLSIVEAVDLKSLEPWTKARDDLVDFEITPVLPSAEYWSTAST
jgi:hypothetical protein